MNPQMREAMPAQDGGAAAPIAEQAPPPVPAPAPAALTAGEQQASPEEQALYERFVSRAFMLIYAPTFFPEIVEMLKGEGDPLEGLARATSMVVVRVMGAAKENGQEMPGDVLFHAAKEIFEDLADLSGRAGVKDYGADIDALEGAFFRAIDQLRVELAGSGEIDQGALQADLETLQRMDEAGELEGLFRDLAARDESGGPTANETATEPQSQPEPPAGGNGLMPRGMN